MNARNPKVQDHSEGSDACRFALLTYSTDNLGDEIQSIAAEQFLPGIDLRIDRERLDNKSDAEDVKMILHGWHTHKPEQWPPAPFIKPLITSLHISREIWHENTGGLKPSEILLRGDSLRYLRAHQPIGARDLDTLELLRQHGIDAHFSACLTLTLGTLEPRQRGDYVCAIDLAQTALEHLKEITRSRLIVGSHELAPGGAYGARAYLARNLLSLYAHAKCVVTSRLHCALPCLALGTPVLFILDATDSYRFHGLHDLVRTYSLQDYLASACLFDADNPSPNSDAFLFYRRNLIEQASSFAQQKLANFDHPPFPFTPEPLSERLLQCKLPRKSMPEPELRAFHRAFPKGLEFKSVQRPDFLRSIGEIHASAGDYQEAIRLLEIAKEARPDDQYIRKLLAQYSKSENFSRQSAHSQETELLAQNLIDAGLTYLSRPRLKHISDEISKVKAREVPGDFVEFGVALGGSGIYLACQLDGARSYRGFDRFGMIPPPTHQDDAGAHARYEIIASGQSKGLSDQPYYGYLDDLYSAAIANFQRFGLKVDQRTIRLIKGLFGDTLPQQEHWPIAFAHIDCDWYEPVKLCLDFVYRRLSRYGVIVLDDYNDWSGCKKAVDEFCSEHDDIIVQATEPHAAILKL